MEGSPQERGRSRGRYSVTAPFPGTAFPEPLAPALLDPLRGRPYNPPRSGPTVSVGAAMITGYNTDVRYRERVFHVQTEDKGLANPCIESVVYYGGQVLAARRASYADLVEEGKGT